MHFTAKDLCKKAITVDVTKKMSDALDIMLKYNISRVIIENNHQQPVGIITEKDIGRYLYKENSKSLDEITISEAIRKPL
jgi:CBS domain-containing protein